MYHDHTQVSSRQINLQAIILAVCLSVSEKKKKKRIKVLNDNSSPNESHYVIRIATLQLYLRIKEKEGRLLTRKNIHLCTSKSSLVFITSSHESRACLHRNSRYERDSLVDDSFLIKIYMHLCMYIPIRYEKVLAVSIEIPAFSIPQLASPPPLFLSHFFR